MSMVVCLHVCLHIHVHVCSAPRRPERKSRSSGTGVTGDYEHPCGWWEPNQGLEKRSVFSRSTVSLGSPPFFPIYLSVYLWDTKSLTQADYELTTWQMMTFEHLILLSSSWVLGFRLCTTVLSYVCYWGSKPVCPLCSMFSAPRFF